MKSFVAVDRGMTSIGLLAELLCHQTAALYLPQEIAEFLVSV
jgi:hypothetical protein